MRSPVERAWLICSSTLLTASSTSLKARWVWRRASASINSDFVMGPLFLAEARGGKPPLARQLVGLVHLLFEESAELGRATSRRGVVSHGVSHVFLVLGTDGQLQLTALAVHAGELRLDGVANLQVLRSVVDAFLGDVVRTDVALDAFTEVDGRTLGVDFADGTVEDRAARIRGHELTERILLHLLDAEGDALTLRVDRENHGFDFVALLEVANEVFTRGLPRDIGQVDETIDAAVQTDEDTEIGDRLDLTGNLVALLVHGGESFPRVRAGLLDTEGDTTTLFIDVEDHDFRLVTDLHDLGRVDVLVGPIHFRHVHEAFDARLDLDEATVIGHVGDLAEQTAADRVAARDGDPRVVAELLEAERNAVALAVVLEHADVQLVADVDDFGRVTHALPRHVGDVQQAVDAAEVDECAVIGEVLDHTLHDRAFRQALEQLLALFRALRLDNRAAADDDVVALAIELDDLDLEVLALEVDRVTDRTHVDQGARQECADVLDVDREAALDLAGDLAGDGLFLVERLLEVVPHHRTLGLLTGELGLAEAVFERVERDLNFVAHFHFQRAGLVLELLDGDDAFALQAGVDHHHVVADFHNDTGDDGAGLQLGNGLLALFKQFGKTFSHVDSRVMKGRTRRLHTFIGRKRTGDPPVVGA